MAKRIIAFLVLLFFLVITGASSAFAFSSRSKAIDAALDRLELSNADMSQVEKSFSDSEEDYTPQFSDSSELIKEKREDHMFTLNPEQRFLISLGLGVQTGEIIGDTTYHISFDNSWAVGGHGESELEWPLNNSLFGITALLHTKAEGNEGIKQDKDKAGLRIEWVTNISKKGGKIKDSDWIENDIGHIDYYDDGILNGSAAWASQHGGKDIYSESDAHLEDVNIIDLSYTYNFWVKQNWAVGPRIGFRYEKFEFSAWNLDQVGYGPYNDPRFYMTYKDTHGWKWLEYERKCSFPYLGFSSEILLGDECNLSLTFGYSGWTDIEDRDIHLYPNWDANNPGHNRDMVSEGDCRGDIYMLGLNSNWKFWSDWDFLLGAKYIDIDTKGSLTQHTYVDGILYSAASGIDDKVTSSYWLVNMAVEYNF